jgi:hypothetical protein
MRAIDALPKIKYIAALKHSSSEIFIRRKNNSLERVKQMYADERVNQEEIPGLWFGGGKDSMAVSILLAKAGIEVNHLSVNNGGDIKGHELIFPEWRDWYEKKFRVKPNHIVYKSEKRFPLLVRYYLDWGKSYGFRNLSFWNWGQVGETICYEISDKFQEMYVTDKDNPMMIWGSRGGEGQERAFAIAKRGLLQPINHEEGRELFAPYVRSLPIGDWKDIDVWAYLIENDAPVSVIYSYHEIAQKNGNRRFPRTLWYPSGDIFCSVFYKWMAKYSPAQLKELCELCPEIRVRLENKEKVLEKPDL